MDNSSAPSSPAARTALFDLHARLGARFTTFAGYEMPVQYPAGVLQEHLHTRAEAGLFDVSHMGQIALRAKTGDVDAAARALERLTPVDVLALKPGRQRYAVFTNDAGGVLDDLMIARRADHLLLVVNAACKAADLAHLQERLQADCEIEALEDRALLALQGPSSEAALAALAPETAQMRFMDVIDATIAGAPATVSRSGYTGEDGFEISLPSAAAEAVAEALVAQPGVAPIGLGARDSLRLEAALCLYGADLDGRTTPVAAGLSWAIQKSRRADGVRAGGFLGAATILAELRDGAPRRRVCLQPEGRAPMRAGVALFAAPDADAPIGQISSGGFGPSVAAPVAMGYVDAQHSAIGARVYGDVRGKRLPAAVVQGPFAPHRYKRG